MLQTLSRTSEGWRQISGTQGGWQSICQGTVLGDALVHDLKGELNNPGWCIGDTPYLSILEKNKLLMARAAQSKLREAPKAAWTAHSLKEFMGFSMKGKVLKINTEYDEMYFELLTKLDLLPEAVEEKERWFQRIVEYERENLIRLDDMVQAALELRKKEEIKQRSRVERVDEGDEEGEEKEGKIGYVGDDDDNDGVVVKTASLKPVYVMGQQVTTRMLQERDMDAQEQLEGVV
jgi:hypothetical protein